MQTFHLFQEFQPPLFQPSGIPCTPWTFLRWVSKIIGITQAVFMIPGKGSNSGSLVIKPLQILRAFLKNRALFQRKQRRQLSPSLIFFNIPKGKNLRNYILVLFQLLFKKLYHIFSFQTAVFRFPFVHKKSKGLQPISPSLQFFQIQVQAVFTQLCLFPLFSKLINSADSITVQIIKFHENIPLFIHIVK